MKVQVPFGQLEVGTKFQRWTLGGGRPWWTKVEPWDPVYSHAKERYISINCESCGPRGQYSVAELDDDTLVWVEEEVHDLSSLPELP